ncbi:hypothetical protein Ancab_003053 [Ancistrocladus abbreviatus]
MGFINLFIVASIPVLKVLLITALGSFLALDRIDILGQDARKHLNTVVFFVFSPSLVGSSLAKTITLEDFVKLWYMPFNILITFLIGSLLGWILIKITNAPEHLKGLILGACAAGNLGNLPLIIIPAICQEKGSPFGTPLVCHTYGMAYASLSMAIGAIYLWSFVYNIVRVSSKTYADSSSSYVNSSVATSNTQSASCKEPLLPSTVYISTDQVHQFPTPYIKSMGKTEIPLSSRIEQRLKLFVENINLKALLAPSTIGAFVGFLIGMIPQLRSLLIGSDAPLHVLPDSVSLVGDAAIPTVTLIVGANLVKGLNESGIRLAIVVGIIAVRYIFLPLLGIVIVKGVVRYGLVQADPLYEFVLLLQFAVPPAMNIGTITQLFGAGQNECSVIMLWTYALASVTLTLWSTFFMWLVA